MKRRMKKTAAFLLGLFVTGCSVDDMNTDPNSFYETEPETLFVYAEKKIADHLNTPNVNQNNLRLLMQYWQETIYLDESQYNFGRRDIPDQVWDRYYVEVIQNLKQAKKIVGERSTGDATSANRLAVLELLECFAFQELVDTFGDIPYTQANNLDSYPLAKYDGAATIYADLIQRVKAAVGNLDAAAQSWGAADVIYGGDVAKWKKFGNSLLLRLGIALSDVDQPAAKAAIDQAMAGGIFAGNTDNALFAYESSSPNYSQLYENLVAGGRNDYVAGATLLYHMFDTLASPRKVKDPRIDRYFDKHVLPEHRGGRIGAGSPFKDYSHPGQSLYQPSTPARVMTYSEVKFYEAEAIARNIIAGDPAVAYGAAVTASFEEWGLTATDATDYLNSNSYNYVDYADWKQAIGEQAWVAMYDQPDVAWKFFRRLDYPKLPLPVGIHQSADGVVPVRLTYPVSEITSNNSNRTAAATAIGGDKMATRLFWDVSAP